MKIGTLDITNCKIGSTQVNEVRIGSTLVWQFSSLDPDAQAFLTAAGITDLTITNAINQLVLDLKGYSIWTKMKALYPFVGGTATTHKFNLKNPLDTDAAFRLGFNGGWTHNINGISGNASNTFANTFLNPLSILTLNSTHISLYSRTNIAQEAIDCGCSTTSNNRIASHLKWSDSNSYHDMYSSTVTRITHALGATASTTLFITNRNASNVFNLWRNGTKLTTQTNTLASSLPNFNLYLGARNTGASIDYPSSRNYAFASIGDGLTDQNATDLTTAINTFQTSLSRNV
jgi:hypothetical protein